MNLSYSVSLWRNSSLYASLNREIGSSGYSAQLQLSIPFDSWGTASFSAARDNNNRWSERVSYSRAAPTDGGFGWNLAYANNPSGGDYRQADLTSKPERAYTVPVMKPTTGEKSAVRWSR